MVNAIRTLLLGIILLEIPLQLDIYLGSTGVDKEFSYIEGINVSISSFCLALLYLFWVPALIARAEVTREVFRRISRPALLYPAIVAASMIVAQSSKLAAFEFFLILQAFLLYVYIAHWIKGRRDVLFVVTMLLVGLAMQGSIMIGLRAVGHSIRFAGVGARIDDNMRVGGTIGAPNGAGSYLALVLPLSLAVLMSDSRRGLKCLATLAFALGGTAILLTESRGSWVAATVGLVSLCFIAFQYGRLTLRVPVVIGTAALCLMPIFLDDVSSRLLEDDGGAAYSRVPLMKLTFHIIRDHPILGVGANNFGLVAPQYAELSAFREIWLQTVHNKYLLVCAETGLLGLAVFLCFMIGIVRRGWRAWRLHDPIVSLMALGLTLGIVGHMVHMFVDIFNGRAFVQLTWLYAGVLTAMTEIGATDDDVA